LKTENKIFYYNGLLVVATESLHRVSLRTEADELRRQGKLAKAIDLYEKRVTRLPRYPAARCVCRL
jgi:hypothetical protein